MNHWLLSNLRFCYLICAIVWAIVVVWANRFNRINTMIFLQCLTHFYFSAENLINCMIIFSTSISTWVARHYVCTLESYHRLLIASLPIGYVTAKSHSQFCEMSHAWVYLGVSWPQTPKDIPRSCHGRVSVKSCDCLCGEGVFEACSQICYLTGITLVKDFI